jgi:predicted nucleic acid-binding protein
LKYLLDTCLISELIKPSPDKNVTQWIKGEYSESLFISVITLGELRKGLYRIPSSGKKEKLSSWLNTLLEKYSERILTIDLTVAEN